MMLDVLCLALNIYWEARNQPDIGQRGVSHVVLNRMADPRFPDSICDVIHQPAQFSWFWDGLPDIPTTGKAWDRANRIAVEVISGQSLDPTGGALYYHANTVRPYWAAEFTLTVVISDHYFYTD